MSALTVCTELTENEQANYTNIRDGETGVHGTKNEEAKLTVIVFLSRRNACICLNTVGLLPVASLISNRGFKHA
jgi:hypothetical protein